jgi:hypothetical protein
MKKRFIILLLFLGLVIITFGQTTFSAFRGSFSTYIGYFNLNSESNYFYSGQNYFTKEKASGYSLGVKGDCSLLGSLFYEESKFFFGDYIGGEIGFTSMKREYNGNSSSSTYGLTFGFDLGLSTGYAISDKVEIGIQVLIFHGFLATDYDDVYSFSYGPVFIPTIKFENAMLMLGYGKGSVGDYGYDAKLGDAIIIEPRIFNEDSNKYLFLRFERNWRKQTTFVGTTIDIDDENSTLLSFGVGFSPKRNPIVFGRLF